MGDVRGSPYFTAVWSGPAIASVAPIQIQYSPVITGISSARQSLRKQEFALDRCDDAGELAPGQASGGLRRRAFERSVRVWWMDPAADSWPPGVLINLSA